MGGRVTECGKALLAYPEELNPQHIRKFVRCLFHSNGDRRGIGSTRYDLH
jgi:hypothetical protein